MTTGPPPNMMLPPISKSVIKLKALGGLESCDRTMMAVMRKVTKTDRATSVIHGLTGRFAPSSGASLVAAVRSFGVSASLSVPA